MGQSDLQQNRRVILTHHEVLVLVLLFLLCPWNHLLSIHLPTHQLTMLTCLDPACTHGTVQHSTTPTYVLAAPSDTRFVSSVLLLLMLLATLPMVPMTTMMMMMPLMHLGWSQRTTSSSRDSALGTPRFKRTHSRDFFPWHKWAKLRAPYPAAWGMLVSCASSKKWSLAKSDLWYLKNYGRNLSCYKWLVDLKPSKIGQKWRWGVLKMLCLPKMWKDVHAEVSLPAGGENI